MSENSNVAKPFSMLEYGTYTAGVGFLLSAIIKFFITPYYPHFTELANFIAPILTPILSWLISLIIGKFATTPDILRMTKNINNSIKNLKNQIKENTDTLPEEELKKLKARLARHIDVLSLIGVSIHNEVDLVNYLNRID